MLSDTEREELRAKYKNSGIPERFHSLALTSLGVQGKRLREALTKRIAFDYQTGQSYQITYTETAAPYVFTKEMTRLNLGVEHMYLQRYVDCISNGTPMNSNAYVIDWFAGDGDPPFDPSLRYRVETEIIKDITKGIRFYLFSRKLKQPSTWWTQNFLDTLSTYAVKLDLTVGTNADKSANSDVSVSDSTGQKQGRRSTSPGVSIR